MFGNGALRYRTSGVRNGVKVEFYGGFIGADVAPALFNDASKNGGEQRAFSTSHDASDQNQTVGRHGMVQNFLFHMQVFQGRGHGRNGTEHDFDAGGIAVGHRGGIAAIAAAYTSAFLDFMGKVIVRLAGLDERGHGIVPGQAFQSGQKFIGRNGPLRDHPPCSVEAHPCRKRGTQAQVGHAATGSPEQQVVDARIVPADTRFTRIPAGIRHGHFLHFFTEGDGATVKEDGAVIR